ncbi:hypothetical protein [Microbacterium capsulatum]|uniref:Ribbon-helix-helix protein CopG domain-containing protein n=1 Tax=Microbacterium capsulatum TaxID=3041921 RepID=A0ABU0XG10_9MICO|nr:hypothetical protein [Microbacterium sp. ASV81]MDQ4214047.1 hypothetical protein [Microbacterium sp. ASV81]
MARAERGHGEAARPKQPVGRPRVYEDDAERPISVTLRLSPQARAHLREMAEATSTLPGEIVTEAIEQYFQRKFPHGVPSREVKA